MNYAALPHNSLPVNFHRRCLPRLTSCRAGSISSIGNASSISSIGNAGSIPSIGSANSISSIANAISILSSLIHPWGCIRKYIYNYGGKMSIVSVKINTSLVGEGSKTLITEGGMKGTIHDLRASPSGNQPHIWRWLNGCDQEPPQDESDDCLAK